MGLSSARDAGPAPRAEAAPGAPWYLRLGPWIGIGTGPGALAAGGGIAGFLYPRELLLAVPLGVVLLVGLSAAQGIRGQRERSPTLGLTRGAFGGTSGPNVTALLILLGVIGWSGFYVGVASGGVSELLDVPAWVTAVVLATFFVALHEAGRSTWDVLVAVTAVAASAVALLVVFGVPVTAAPARWGQLRPVPVLAAVGAIVAYAAVFAVRAADFTWDLQRAADVVRTASAMALTLLLFLGLGTAMYLRAGSWDLADLVNRTRFPVAGVLLLVLSTVAPTVSGLHSGALALRQLTGRSVSIGVVAVAAVGAVLGAWRFDLLLLSFLRWIGVIVPPILAALLLARQGQPGWHGWTSWAAGSGTAAAAVAFGWPGPVLIGLSVAALVMTGLRQSAKHGREERGHGS